MHTNTLRIAFLIAAAAAAPLAAHGPEAHPTPTPAVRAAEPDGSPAAAIDAFHAALGSGNRDEALRWLAPEVVIFEGGGAEMSRDEYASHHLGSDMEFSKAVKSEIVDRQSGSSGDVAWVLTRTHTVGRFGDRAVDANGVETMVLRRGAEGWRIVHVHWSSYSRKQGG
jgi:ketosteroid isomerase-like protein